MALQVASLFGVLRMDDSDFRSGVKNARSEMTGLGDQLGEIGGKVTSLGTNLTGLAAPVAAAFGVAVHQSVAFNESLTNIGAVLGLTQGQISNLSDELLKIGGSRRAGPQAVAEAFYDIVGGVADASTHMAILTAALDTAEAGGANLKATTSGLISVMNSYGFSADKASHVSDVFTQMVNKGVGSMDEFVAAIGPIAGVAASTGVSFEELGTSAAFLTTKGFGASQAGTRLRAVIDALIKPQEAMTKALKAAGLESGSMALKQYGLVGTLQKVNAALGGSTDALALALGTSEAFGAATALLGDDFKEASDKFVAGIDGATAAGAAIQNLSDQAKLDLLNSQMSELAITTGGALVPSLLQVVESIKPIIGSVIDWVNQNPELVAQIGMVVAGLAVAGPILIGVGAAISAIGAVIGVVLSPIGLIVGALVGLYLAFQSNFLGIQTALQPVIDWLQTNLGNAWDALQAGVPPLDVLSELFLRLLPHDTAQTIIDGANDVKDGLTNIWTDAKPSLDKFANWFITDQLPKIVQSVSDFKTNALDPLGNLLSSIWNRVSPALQSLADWFTKSLPGTGGPIQIWLDSYVRPAIELLTKLGDLGSKIFGTAFNLASNVLNNGNPGGATQAQQMVQSKASQFFNSRYGPSDALGNPISGTVPSSFGNYGVVPLPPPPSGDYKGIHPAGAYVVGTGAQPQLFMPTQDMYGVPNIDQAMGGGGMQFSGDIYVTANDPEEFGAKVKQKYKGRGN